MVPGDREIKHAAPEIDCTGAVVTPGFIDIHTHSDLSFIINPSSDSKVAQGVTTEVIGNCGFSAFPVKDERRPELIQFLRGLGFHHTDINWTDFEGYAKRLADARPVMNIAPLVGHGSLRIAAAGGSHTSLSTTSMNDAKALLRESLDQGAFGMSTGLTYVPSCFAKPNEIHQFAEILNEYDSLYATHSRATSGMTSFHEAVEVGSRTGAKVQFSHVALNDPRQWGQAGEVIQIFSSAADAGINIRYDVYPYNASASALSQYLPDWLQYGSEHDMRERLADPRHFARARADLAAGLYGNIPWHWDKVLISLTGPGDEDLIGKSVEQASQSRGLAPEELCLTLCAQYGNLPQVVLFYRAEADVREFLSDRLAVIGSDGNAMPTTAPGKPHPRSFGAHARLLQRYVRERGDLTLPEAVYKSTHAAAERLGITDRGRIAVGTQADIAVLDFDSIQERATWMEPSRLASGVRHLWINGEQVLASGKLTKARPGRVLRRR
ncbi:N-acyl-D-amino-acid deacylase family protein [Prauserella flavalba]|uniref:N-acyl-D-amino-acid deacylase family protein n=1 Tax=Prauserella flavalba TaxID=1477506 RepID=UPI0036E0D2F3